MKHIIALGICISLVTTTFPQETVRPVPSLNQLEHISFSSTLWWAEFFPNGGAILGCGSNNSAVAPEGSFSFEEIYYLLVPHVKENRAGSNSPVMGVWLSVANRMETRYAFILEDKEVMRKIMHGLCEKVVPDSNYSKSRFEDALRMYRLVPGDPPYLKADEVIRVISNKVEVIKADVTGDKVEEIKVERIEEKVERIEVVGAEGEEEVPPPVGGGKARKTGRPSLFFYVGAGVLVCVGVVLFLTRRR